MENNDLFIDDNNENKDTNEETTPEQAEVDKTAERPRKKLKVALLYSLFGLLFTLGVTIIVVCVWYMTTFDLEFKDLLYTLASPLQGTGTETYREIFTSCVPPVLALSAVFAAAVVLIELPLRRRSARVTKICKRIGAVFCSVLLVFSLAFAAWALRIPKYVELISTKTEFYEQYYVDPEKTLITADGKTKNLIYIYLESMETTYASVEDGGKQEVNYMPKLTELADQYVSFTDKSDGALGGFHTPSGTGWTVAALLATSSGIPFSFPLGKDGNNAMSKEKYFATGLTSLGDILDDFGYVQEFLCGSKATFGGRDKYYEQHGDYYIFDLLTAREEGYVSPNYHNGFWGIDDAKLYSIAKDELLRLADGDEPFNFTMLTVDTHHVAGYICGRCGNEYSEQTANVVSCADAQLAKFIEWCQNQEFYEDSVIIVTGDHPRMDTRLVKGIDYYDRTIYNLFINSAVEAEGETTGRIWTSFDMFPTTLAAMGFTVKGEYLGLGVNMFSGLPTLAEELGYDYFETEISRYSSFYIENFCPELSDRVVTETETEDD